MEGMDYESYGDDPLLMMSEEDDFDIDLKGITTSNGTGAVFHNGSGNYSLEHHYPNLQTEPRHFMSSISTTNGNLYPSPLHHHSLHSVESNSHYHGIHNHSQNNVTMMSPDDRTLASFEDKMCLSVDSMVGGHSLASGGRAGSITSLSCDVHSGIFSMGDTIHSSIGGASLSSRHEAMKLLNDYNHRSSFNSSANNSFFKMGDMTGSISEDWEQQEAAVASSMAMPPPQTLEPTNRNPSFMTTYDHGNGKIESPFLNTNNKLDSPTKRSVTPSSMPSYTTTNTNSNNININNNTNNKPMAVRKSRRTKTKQQKVQGMENGRKIRSLIQTHGTQNVYFGRGEPIRNNPGNVRFRHIVDGYYDEYQKAPKKRKLEIKHEIERNVINEGRQFIVVVEHQGTFKEHVAPRHKITDGTGHALRDTPKRRASYWSWMDAKAEELTWNSFRNKDGASLELMYQEDIHKRSDVKVNINKHSFFVDVTTMTMRPTNNPRSVYKVRRIEPDEGKNLGQGIYVSDFESNGENASSYQTEGQANNNNNKSTVRSSSFQPSCNGQSRMFSSLSMAALPSPEGEISFSLQSATADEIVFEITTLLRSVSKTRASGGHPSLQTEECVSEAPLESTFALQPPSRDQSVTPPNSKSSSSSIIKRIKKAALRQRRTLSNLSKSSKSDPGHNKEQQDEESIIWLWRESRTRMHKHSTDRDVFGDPSDCWIRYDETSNNNLEAAYQDQDGTGECLLDQKYAVDFSMMRQTNMKSGFQRQIRRQVINRTLTTPAPTSATRSLSVEAKKCPSSSNSVRHHAQGHAKDKGPNRSLEHNLLNNKMGRMRLGDDDDMISSAMTLPTTADSLSLAPEDMLDTKEFQKINR